jgi:hypothetical protein
MANSQKKGPSSVPILVILAIIAGAVYISRSPLESSRPEAPVGLRHPVPEREKIDARLWQDPLEVALDHEKAMHEEMKTEDGNSCPKCTSMHDVNQVRERISYLIDINKKDPNDPNTIVHVLLTMVRGGIFAEDYERRLRNRYAILTGLHSSGSAPEDTEHIQYFRMSWIEKDELEKNIKEKKVPKIHKVSKAISEPLVVPYEWFEKEEPYLFDEPEDNLLERILVVWLPENAFSHRPLTRLAQVIDAFSHADFNNVKIDVIGPSSSTTLRNMIKEI